MNNSGKRYFLQTGGNDISDARVKVLLGFARVLESVYKVGNDRKLTHAPLMHYGGYALNASLRQMELEAHTWTNWLSVWVLSCAQMLYPNTFHMRTFTIALITDEWGGPIAEMLITRLACAYYHTGGFCIDQAGTSMSSFYMDKLSNDEWAKVWDGCLEWVKQNTQYDSTKEFERQRRDNLQSRAYQALLKALMAQDKKFRDGIKHFDSVWDKIKHVDMDKMKEKDPALHHKISEYKRRLENQHAVLEKMDRLYPDVPEE